MNCYILSREKMAAPISHDPDVTSALKPTIDAKSNLPNFDKVKYNFHFYLMMFLRFYFLTFIFIWLLE